MTRTLLLFGAGPGIGDNVAATFTSAGIEHVVLLGRNKERLQNEDAPFVSKAASNVKVDILRADLSDLDSIPQVLKELDDLTKGEDVEVVYYNAARIKPTDPVLDVSVAEIEEDFRVRLALPSSCYCHDSNNRDASNPVPPIHSKPLILSANHRLTHTRSKSSPSTSSPNTTSPACKQPPSPTRPQNPSLSLRSSSPTATCHGTPCRSFSPSLS